MIIYFIGLLFSFTACLIWFYSPLKISLGQILFDKDIYTVDQFETRLLIRNALLGKLLSCYICFSFWISLFIGIVAATLHLAPLWFPVVTAGTYPSLCYLYKCIIDRS